MLITQIKADLKQAMKNKEKEKLSTLRLLMTKLENKKIELKIDLEEMTDSQVQDVVTKNIKELDKEIASYEENGRDSSKAKQERELLMGYLPEQISDEELEEFVKAVCHNTKAFGRGMGDAMKFLSGELKGKADMKKVSKMVKEIF